MTAPPKPPWNPPPPTNIFPRGSWRPMIQTLLSFLDVSVFSAETFESFRNDEQYMAEKETRWWRRKRGENRLVVTTDVSVFALLGLFVRAVRRA